LIDDDRDHRQAVRERMRARRAALDVEWVARASHVISEQVQQSMPISHESAVCIYMSLPGEVQTSELARFVLDSRARLAVPRVVRGVSGMTVHEVSDLERDLEPGVWGIPTPRAECPEMPPFEIDLVLVPGLAFDASLHRIGNGGGYYDRFLAAATDASTVGLFFSHQQVDTCHPQAWDVSLDRIVNELSVLERPGQL